MQVILPIVRKNIAAVQIETRRGNQKSPSSHLPAYQHLCHRHRLKVLDGAILEEQPLPHGLLKLFSSIPLYHDPDVLQLYSNLFPLHAFKEHILILHHRHPFRDLLGKRVGLLGYFGCCYEIRLYENYVH